MLQIFQKSFPMLIAVLIFCAAPLFSEGAQEESSATRDSDTTIDFVEVQWSDIASTTAATRIVLEAAGFETTSKIVSVPIAFQSLSTGDIDVFLGDWEPSMKSYTEEMLAEGKIVDLRVNLTGAKYTLAVPEYVAEGGLTDFSDIASFKEKLDGKIYGIEPGNDGNMLIQRMIKEDAFGLEGFDLIESSEAGMLSQLRAMSQNEEWIVFLGWEPHPMNTVFDIRYLTGGDDYFGPDFGAATVHTTVRPGYTEENPNLGRFFKNLEFNLAMENEIMKDIADGMKAREAADKWLKANPAILDTWLEGVNAANGKPALPVVRKNLGLE